MYLYFPLTERPLPILPLFVVLMKFLNTEIFLQNVARSFATLSLLIARAVKFRLELALIFQCTVFGNQATKVNIAGLSCLYTVQTLLRKSNAANN